MVYCDKYALQGQKKTQVVGYFMELPYKPAPFLITTGRMDL